jgi:hypothetical protein
MMFEVKIKLNSFSPNSKQRKGIKYRTQAINIIEIYYNFVRNSITSQCKIYF